MMVLAQNRISARITEEAQTVVTLTSAQRRSVTIDGGAGNRIRSRQPFTTFNTFTRPLVFLGLVSSLMTSPTLNDSQFLDAVTTSGLVGESDLARVTTESGPDATEIAAPLESRGLLTAFQIQALREGRGTELRIGNYDLLDRLGAGGMGTVYKARHRRMKRIVALKVLSPEISRDESFVRRFQREVETIASLGHPNM
ncbi:MAG: protein kinase domain-containing protein, partial [Planctomycetota bacterium]